MNKVPLSSAKLKLVPASVVFDASMFVATSTCSAARKAQFANRLVQFFDNRCLPELYTKGVYRTFAESFGLDEASEGRQHFYQRNCRRAQDRLRLVKQIVEHEIAGDPTTSTADLQRAIKRWMQDYLLRKFEQTAMKVEAMPK